jgi:hypothetical protein
MPLQSTMAVAHAIIASAFHLLLRHAPIMSWEPTTLMNNTLNSLWTGSPGGLHAWDRVSISNQSRPCSDNFQ